MTIDTFVSRAKDELQTILRKSGSILYSAPRTLKKGDYYFLGLNPGGSVAEIKETIDDSLNQMLEGSCCHNAYLYEDWSSKNRKYKKGEHPLLSTAIEN